MDSDPSLDPGIHFRVLNWIGIIEQLMSTRLNQELRDTGIPVPQFIMLNHFNHRPTEGKTVTSVASAMQQPQPGVTKTIQKLVQRGYLRIEVSKSDGRLKYHYLTAEGIAAHRQALHRIMPMVNDIFQGWDEAEVVVLLGLLDRLKVYLDEHRQN